MSQSEVSLARAMTGENFAVLVTDVGLAATSSEDMDELTSTAPEGYSLSRRIGKGASSVVWEALEHSTGQAVALKMLEAEVTDPDAVRRFERERDAMRSLAAHPNIVTIIDAGVQGGRPWLAMELCRRGSLAAYVATGGALPISTVVRVLVRLADALSAAHEAEVVHCDIKPGNIMLNDSGEPAVGDFGIARVSVGQAATTTVGGFSLDHVAPELLDDGERSARSDIYSLGTTAWELLVGHPPFRQTDDVSVGAVLTRILRRPLPESPQIQDEVLTLLRTMAAKLPEDRPASMREVERAVRELAHHLDIDPDESAVPALTSVEREVSLLPLAATDDDLLSAPTHLRSAPPEDSAPVRQRNRRISIRAAATLAVVLAMGGAAVGAYRIVSSQSPEPAPLAQLPSSPVVTTSMITQISTPDPVVATSDAPTPDPPPATHPGHPAPRSTKRRAPESPVVATTELENPDAPKDLDQPAAPGEPVDPGQSVDPSQPADPNPAQVAGTADPALPLPEVRSSGSLSPQQIPLFQIELYPTTTAQPQGKVYPGP